MTGNELVIYPNGQSQLERIQGHWLERIKGIAEKLTGGPINIVFQLPLNVGGKDVAKSEKIAIVGTYYDDRNKIIKPSRIFSGTQYFRKQWLPLLGPTLAWLIVELRQRCYYGRGEDEKQRDYFTTTYDDLARAIGVSEITVKRLLARDKEGHFKSEYIGYFIKGMASIKQRTNGKIHGVGSKFTIFLDEPLTPEDEAKLTELTEVSK